MAQRTKYLPIFIVSVAAIAALILGNPTFVSADAAKAGLRVSPVIIDLNVDKGTSYSVNVKVTNVTVDDQQYTGTISDFTSKDESGAPKLFDDLLPATSSVKSWLSTIPTFALKAGESKSLLLQVNVPANAEPGGHYGALVFTGKAAGTLQPSGVTQTASAAELMLFTVSGNITEKASVSSFYTAPNSTDNQSSFFEKAPITFVTRIKNEGNVHLKPSGQILVHDMFGNLVSSVAMNGDKANVLPGSIRRFDTTLNSSWMFGLYSADLQLGYGSHGQALTNTISFWVIPYKIVGVALVVLATIIFILVRMVKVYNRRIVTRAIQKHENNKTNHSKK